jgi:prophage regulatory protein
MSDTILRLPQVIDRVGLRRSAIYAAVQAGTFPRPVNLGCRAVGWRERDIAAWIDTRTATPVSPTVEARN